MSPVVSVCLPNLRNRAFLPERIDSIQAQTLTDWELVVFDNHSDDGAWEYLCERAAAEPRMRLAQAPRNGMYANWNNCIRAAQGQFVYIATSDDTMAPDCLEKLARALNENRQCGVAQCPLRILGEDAQGVQGWWDERSPISKSLSGKQNISHLRRAPLDGLLHLAGRSVVLSITQTLMRREVFERIGYFREDCGSIADFEWQARCALVCDSIFVGDTWGGWRLHPEQATALNAASGQDKLRINMLLFRDALERAAKVGGYAVRSSLRRDCEFLSAVHQAYEFSRGRGTIVRLGVVFRAICRWPAVVMAMRHGPEKLLNYIRDPERYVIDEVAAQCIVPMKSDLRSLNALKPVMGKERN